MYYITVSNDLLTPTHKKRMGIAVWEFMWCLDKITKIDDDGVGWVLGGKPVKLSEIGMGHDNTTSRNLIRLEKMGYIKLIHAPYGLSIRVNKAKKRFNKSSEPLDKKSFTKNSEPSTNNGEPPLINGEPNKIVSIDITEDITVAGTSPANLIPQIIKLFEKVNPANKGYYGNPTQRKAVQNLLDEYGFKEVSQVIAYLPRANKTPYLPTITTPAQLWDRYQALKDGIAKNKGILTAKGRGLET